MERPRVGQWVWAEGLRGTFTVVRVDEDRGQADLEITSGTHFIEQHVPFSKIHPVGEDLTSKQRLG